MIRARAKDITSSRDGDLSPHSSSTCAPNTASFLASVAHSPVLRRRQRGVDRGRKRASETAARMDITWTPRFAPASSRFPPKLPRHYIDLTSERMYGRECRNRDERARRRERSKRSPTLSTESQRRGIVKRLAHSAHADSIRSPGRVADSSTDTTTRRNGRGSKPNDDPQLSKRSPCRLEELAYCYRRSRIDLVSQGQERTRSDSAPPPRHPDRPPSRSLFPIAPSAVARTSFGSFKHSLLLNRPLHSFSCAASGTGN